MTGSTNDGGSGTYGHFNDASVRNGFGSESCSSLLVLVSFVGLGSSGAGVSKYITMSVR